MLPTPLKFWNSQIIPVFFGAAPWEKLHRTSKEFFLALKGQILMEYCTKTLWEWVVIHCCHVWNQLPSLTRIWIWIWIRVYVHILKVLEQMSSIKTIPILFENFLEVHLKWGLPLSFLQPGAEVLQSFPAGQDSIKMLQPNSADSHSARKWTPPAPLTIHFSLMMTIFAQYCVHSTCLNSVQAIIICGLA